MPRNVFTSQQDEMTEQGRGEEASRDFLAAYDHEHQDRACGLQSPISILARVLPFGHKSELPAVRSFRRQIEGLNLPHNPSAPVTPISRLPYNNQVDAGTAIGRKTGDFPAKPRRFWFGKLHSRLQPKGPGSNDCAVHDRTLNILTSLPIIALGSHIRRKNPSSEVVKQYGSSVMLVGLAATAYHSSAGNLRTLLRKADYYVISASSAFLTRALHSKRTETLPGRLAMVSSLLAVPFKPSCITACHSAAVEVEYLRQAQRHKHLRRHHAVHCASLAAGLIMFGTEDYAIRNNIHITHSLWHCFALNSIASVTPLIHSVSQHTKVG